MKKFSILIGTEHVNLSQKVQKVEILGPFHTYPDIFESANFFFPHTAIVHTHTANSQANPEIF